MSNTVTMQEHPEKADYSQLRQEQSLLQSYGVTVAQGEQPMSEFAYDAGPQVSLGQVAREYRSGHPVERPKQTVIP